MKPFDKSSLCQSQSNKNYQEHNSLPTRENIQEQPTSVGRVILTRLLGQTEHGLRLPSQQLKLMSKPANDTRGYTKQFNKSLGPIWADTQKVNHSKDGKVGVSFFYFPEGKACVVKPSFFPILECFLLKLALDAQLFSPRSRLSLPIENKLIVQCINDKKINRDNRLKVLELYNNRPQDEPYVIMEKMNAKRLDQCELGSIQDREAIFFQLGEFLAFDMMLNNFDRVPNRFLGFHGCHENIVICSGKLCSLDVTLNQHPQEGVAHFREKLIQQTKDFCLFGLKSWSAYTQASQCVKGVASKRSFYLAFRQGFLKKVCYLWQRFSSWHLQAIYSKTLSDCPHLKNALHQSDLDFIVENVKLCHQAMLPS